MLRHIITVYTIVALTSALRVERNDLWKSFKVRHNRTYVGQTDTFRRHVWESNLDYIERHNIEEARGLHTYTMGENRFTDMTNEEFRKMNSHKKPKFSSRSGKRAPPNNNGGSPGYRYDYDFDWRTYKSQHYWPREGYVSPVKDQGNCGSCWAFSALGALESQAMLRGWHVTDLSEQQLLDCAKSEDTNGCEGGWMDDAFEYIIQNGIDDEPNYPYTAHEGNSCKYRASGEGLQTPGGLAFMYLLHEDLMQGNETYLAQALKKLGPISLTLDANQTSFQNYKSGVYKDPKCGSPAYNHAVLLVGFGVDPQHGYYWTIKNSWGTGWGEGGYARIARYANNMCGIASFAVIPRYFYGISHIPCL